MYSKFLTELFLHIPAGSPLSLPIWRLDTEAYTTPRQWREGVTTLRLFSGASLGVWDPTAWKPSTLYWYLEVWPIPSGLRNIEFKPTAEALASAMASNYEVCPLWLPRLNPLTVSHDFSNPLLCHVGILGYPNALYRLKASESSTSHFSTLTMPLDRTVPGWAWRHAVLCQSQATEETFVLPVRWEPLDAEPRSL